MQVPILNGIYADAVGDFRTAYPRNRIPVPKENGISRGFLRPADGLVQFATGLGADRGGIRWNDVLYRASGTQLVKVAEDGAVTDLGYIGGAEPVRFDYSFDVLSVASDGGLYFFDGVSLTQNTDVDMGPVLDQMWVDGYFMTTDGTSLVVTELTDRYSVNPLKYGSSESDPDSVKALLKLSHEIFAVNRYTIEAFENVGGDLFPFSRIDSAQINRGAIGSRGCCLFLDAIAFLGGGRNESPAVWLGLNGQTTKLSTHEIDTILGGYTEAELAGAVLEAKSDRSHQHLMLHLPDQCWVYDAAASKIFGEPVWFELTSSIIGAGQYRARGHVWVYDQWIAGDPTGTAIARLDNTLSSHYGQANGWDFGTSILYNEGNGAVIPQLELVGLPGRVAFGDDPVIWTSYSVDGETWSQEAAVSAGKQGERGKRMVWFDAGGMEHYRMQRFRGTSDAHVSFARLELQVEALDG